MQYVLLVGGELNGKRVTLPEDVTVFHATIAPKVALPFNARENEQKQEILKYCLYPSFLLMSVSKGLLPFTIGCPEGESPTSAFGDVLNGFSLYSQQQAQDQHRTATTSPSPRPAPHRTAPQRNR